jgi:uncharacterized protein
MALLHDIPLSSAERSALIAFREAVRSFDPSADLVLFGSKARGSGAPDSDLDVLIVTDQTATAAVQSRLAEIQFGVELKYDIVIGLVIENRAFWGSAQGHSLPLHWAIDREGVAV